MWEIQGDIRSESKQQLVDDVFACTRLESKQKQSYGSDNLAHGVFATASAPTSGTNCSDIPDNCVEPMDTFSTGLAASGSASSAGDPVVFGGGGGNDNLWKVDFNNKRDM